MTVVQLESYSLNVKGGTRQSIVLEGKSGDVVYRVSLIVGDPPEKEATARRIVQRVSEVWPNPLPVCVKGKEIIDVPREAPPKGS